MSTSGLSKSTLNLKFMQRNRQPAPASASQDDASKTQGSSAAGPSTSRLDDPFPVSASASSGISHNGKQKRKVIIEPGYASFPSLLKHASFSKGAPRLPVNAEENSGRQTFGQKPVQESKGKDKKVKAEEDDDESMPSSSDDEPKPQQTKKAKRLPPSQEKPAAVPPQRKGFQKPPGFSDVKPKHKAKKADEDEVEEMIQGARAKRVKREPSASPKKVKSSKSKAS